MSSRRHSRLAWFPFYVDDWQGGVRALTAPESGQYLALILAQWASKTLRAIPADEARLRLLCWGEMPSPTVLSKFDTVDEAGCKMLRNRRLAEEWDKAFHEYSGKAHGGGRKQTAPDTGPVSAPESAPVRAPHTAPQPQPQPQPQTDRTTERTGAPTNPLIPKGGRPKLESELCQLVQREAELTDRDGAEVMAEVSHYEGARTSKLNPATMSDDRLLNSLLDARARVKRLEERKQ